MTEKPLENIFYDFLGRDNIVNELEGKVRLTGKSGCPNQCTSLLLYISSVGNSGTAILQLI